MNQNLSNLNIFVAVFISVEISLTTNYPYTSEMADHSTDEFKHARVDIKVAVSQILLQTKSSKIQLFNKSSGICSSIKSSKECLKIEN